MKFVYEITRNSIQDNLYQLRNRGMLNMDNSGVPAEARMRIEDMFRQVDSGGRDPLELKSELDHWGIIKEYEDRFLTMFRRGRRSR